MSARLTVETVTVTTRPGMVDRLGYMYCATCDEAGKGHGRGHGPYPEVHAGYPIRGAVTDSDIDTDRACNIGQRCGGCNVALADFPTRKVQAEVVVEHPPCRIF